MSIIKEIRVRQILDSRGNPTVEADVILDDGTMGRAAVPSGASTGSGEALELRDGGSAFGGKGVQNAVKNIREILAPALIGKDPTAQRELDTIMIEHDGTDNKSKIGANAILAVSLVLAKAAAASQQKPLWRYIADMTGSTPSLPLPMMNIENGGAHANFATDIQEYMIIPKKAVSIDEAVQMGAEIFHTLGSLLKGENYTTTVGDEGGYAPIVKGGNREPLELITHAIRTAGYEPGQDVVLALDVASSEFFHDGMYRMLRENRDVKHEDMIRWLTELVDQFPIVSIEDGCSENDWDGWKMLRHQLGERIQLVGDDLFVTNTAIIQRGIDEQAANAVLIKPNQIGSLTETIDAVKLAQSAGWRTIMSHRSGETEDVTIAHLAVGLGCGQIKTGSLSRSERVAKYNELMRIAEASPELQLAQPFGRV